MNNKSKDLGVIIGRFQIDELSDGHKMLIGHVLELHEHVLVLVGSQNTPATETNPLPFAFREEMLDAAYPNQLWVQQLNDHRNDKVWSANVDEQITECLNYGNTAILYCGRDGFKPHYFGKFKVRELHFDTDNISATARRKYCGKNPDIASVAFRQGVIYALHNLPPRIYLPVGSNMSEKKRTRAVIIPEGVDADTVYAIANEIMRQEQEHIELIDSGAFDYEQLIGDAASFARAASRVKR